MDLERLYEKLADRQRQKNEAKRKRVIRCRCPGCELRRRRSAMKVEKRKS